MASSLPKNVHISNHPCLKAKLSQLRSHKAGPRETQLLIDEITTFLGVEALASCLDTEEAGTDTSPLGYPFTVQALTSPSISLIPILRSGLSMVASFSKLLPTPVPVHHLGLYRERTTLQPVEYYNNLPYHKPSPSDPNMASHQGPSKLAVILDPVIATGATMAAAIETLREWGVERVVVVSVLASKGGVEKAAGEWENVEVWVGGVDDGLDEKGMIKPGLGDVGDRLFLTVGK